MRIVSLVPSHTEILFALGLGDLVVGVTQHCDYPPEVGEKERIGFFGSPDLERIVALKPDLVITGGKIHDGCASELKGLGINVYAFEPTGVEALLKGMEDLLALTGSRQTGVLSDLRRRLERISCLVRDCYRPRAAFVMGESTLAVPGPANCQYDALRISGTEPMPCEEDIAFRVVDWSDVAGFNPEILLVCGYKKDEPVRKRCLGCTVKNRPCAREISAVTSNPLLAEVDALKRDQVYTVPCHYFCRPGPRLFEGMEWLSSLVRRLSER